MLCADRVLLSAAKFQSVSLFGEMVCLFSRVLLLAGRSCLVLKEVLGCLAGWQGCWTWCKAEAQPRAVGA